MRLKDEVALVTGSTRGIGASIASEFAREGASVIVTGRTEEKGHALVDAIKADGGKAIFIAADLASESDIERLAREAAAGFGRLTILVNNAAPTDLLQQRIDGVATDVTAENWRIVLDRTLTSTFLVCKHVIPHLKAAGGGAIVNISSGTSEQPLPHMSAYSASKATMNSLCRSIAVDFASDAIRCNSIIAGLIVSSAQMRQMLDNTAWGARIKQTHLTRLGAPEDIAAAAAFLASREATFITGAQLLVDGGARLGGERLIGSIGS